MQSKYAYFKSTKVFFYVYWGKRVNVFIIFVKIQFCLWMFTVTCSSLCWQVEIALSGEKCHEIQITDVIKQHTYDRQHSYAECLLQNTRIIPIATVFIYAGCSENDILVFMALVAIKRVFKILCDESFCRLSRGCSDVTAPCNWQNAWIKCLHL
jgi:hypothetical protein